MFTVLTRRQRRFGNPWLPNTLAEDDGKQKFVIRKYYKWEMMEDKDIKVQINEYHKLIKDLKSENITLQEEFVARLLIEKLP